MTEGQNGLYLLEWGKVRRILRETMSPADTDAQRHALHLKALGKDKSSKRFTNADLDEVLKVFRAISEPGNVKTQIELDDMAAERVRFSIRRLLAALNLDEQEIELMIWRRQQAGRMLSCSATASATFETIGIADLNPLMLALKKQCQAKWARKGDLLTEIRLVRMENEFDEADIAARVKKELRLRVVPATEAFDYDELLSVLAILRRMARGELAMAPAAASEEPDWSVE